MSLVKKIKSVGSQIRDKYQERKTNIENKKNLLSTLNMKQLQDLTDLYEIDIIWSGLINESPTEKDYINSLAKSHIELKSLERWIQDEMKKKESSNIPHQVIKINQLDTGGGNFTGNVLNTNIYNTFQNQIMQLDIDLTVKAEAIRRIKEMEEEMNKPNPDNSKLNQLVKWFSRNKEIAAIATPIIAEIISRI